MDALDLYYKEYNNIKKLHRVMPRLLNKFVIFGSEESKIDVIDGEVYDSKGNRSESI